MTFASTPSTPDADRLGTTAPAMTERHDPWPAAYWELVRPHLPPPPARIVEIGCGAAGGVVPALLAAGYDPLGVDPQAPPGTAYVAAPFEAVPAAGVAAVIASMALHHVSDLDLVLEHAAEALAPGGLLVVLEWDWTRFDEAAARWCFERLADGPDVEPDGWLRRHRDGAAAAGTTWDRYLRGWAEDHGIHAGSTIRAAIDRRFEQLAEDSIPYFFTELAVDAAAEASAIASGELAASAFRYVGRPIP